MWALGDCAEVRDPDTGQPYPPTAQHAIRQGKIIAENIAASIQGGPKRAFRYKLLGVLASLGRRSAVAEILGFRFSGFFAWWLWRTIYLMKLPSFERKAAPGVVEVEVPGKPGPKRCRRLVRSQVDVLIFHASPQSLNEDIVDPPPLAVHADRHPVRLEYVGERLGGELCALVGVEYLM